jgi:hypothetical protein
MTQIAGAFQPREMTPASEVSSTTNLATVVGHEKGEAAHLVWFHKPPQIPADIAATSLDRARLNLAAHKHFLSLAGLINVRQARVAQVSVVNYKSPPRLACKTSVCGLSRFGAQFALKVCRMGKVM